MKVTIQGHDSKIYIANQLVMVEPEHPTSFKVGEEVILKLIEGDNHGIVIDPLDREANPYNEKWKVTYLKPNLNRTYNTKPYIKPLDYEIGVPDYIIITGMIILTLWFGWMFIKII